MVEPPGIAPGLSVFQTVLRTSYNKTPIKMTCSTEFRGNVKGY